MIDIYKLIKGITVKHKVGSNDDSEMMSQFSSFSPTCTYKMVHLLKSKFIMVVRLVRISISIFQYVRVDDQALMHRMIYLLTGKWKLPRPKLLISVTGGAKDFTMRPRLKDVFRRGLVRAAESTG